MHNKFSSCLIGKAPGVYLRVEVEEGRHALCRQKFDTDNILVALLAWLC